MLLQARSYANLQDIHIAGVIVYTGTNPNARMHSQYFLGSEELVELAEMNKICYENVIDYIETGLKYVHLPGSCAYILISRLTGLSL